MLWQLNSHATYKWYNVTKNITFLLLNQQVWLDCTINGWSWIFFRQKDESCLSLRFITAKGKNIFKHRLNCRQSSSLGGGGTKWKSGGGRVVQEKEVGQSQVRTGWNVRRKEGGRMRAFEKRRQDNLKRLWWNGNWENSEGSFSCFAVDHSWLSSISMTVWLSGKMEGD